MRVLKHVGKFKLLYFAPNEQVLGKDRSPYMYTDPGTAEAVLKDLVNGVRRFNQSYAYDDTTYNFAVWGIVEAHEPETNQWGEVAP